MTGPMNDREAACVGDVVALLRAAVIEDADALRQVITSLDAREDDWRGLVLHLSMLGATALRNAEHGVDGALAVVDSVAAQARGEQP